MLTHGALCAQASMKALKAERMAKYLAMDPADRKGVQALLDTITSLERASARPARPRIQSGRALADRIKMLSMQ